MWGWSDEGGVNAVEIIRGGLVSVVSYAVVLLVRLRFGLHELRSTQGIGLLTLPSLLRTFLKHPNPYGWPILLILMVTPVVLLGVFLRPHLRSFGGRVLVAASAIVAITAVFGQADELRVFVTPLAVAVYALVDAGNACEAVAVSTFSTST